MPDIHPTPVRTEALSVFVEGLALSAEVGLYPHERGRFQPLSVDVELYLSPAHVAGISGTVNYETLVDKAKALAASGHIELVETFAERLAAACMDHPRAQRVRVRVRKPEAIAGADAAGVELTAVRA
ncbi:dihydroneopterin aldolase [Caulobacter sp. S45]|uniref:dihydroneopterin aldolase n=1 Tax=Caulobacter sp. S45 TaxID=1641861 RepID=UPI0020B131FF|nr:dihydroneopterin aldolase [Caulobacter sp. S45]